MRKDIKNCLLNAIRNRVKIAFALSQAVVPVDTGYLKKTGKEKNIPNGAEIKYSAEYASYVESGLTARWVDVRAYRRSGAWVREHRRWQPKESQKNILRIRCEILLKCLPPYSTTS
jgi:hypothetical protein